LVPSISVGCRHFSVGLQVHETSYCCRLTTEKQLLAFCVVRMDYLNEAFHCLTSVNPAFPSLFAADCLIDEV
jgi:hypothetical protein